MAKTTSSTPSTSAEPGASGAASGVSTGITARGGASNASGDAAALKQQAGELADAAQDKVQGQFDQQKQRATEALSGVTEALHTVGDALRESDQNAFAGYADAAAQQLEAFTRSIRNRSVGEILDEAEGFARRDPALFIGGAFLLGVFGARFIKASAPDRFGRNTGYRQGPYDARGMQRYGAGGYGTGGHDAGRYGRGMAPDYRGYDAPVTRTAGTDRTAGGEVRNPSSDPARSRAN